jgi:hypothetical protein
MDKKILEKLMALNGDTTNKYLIKLAVDIHREITQADNNDDIFVQLEILEEFIYRVPSEYIMISNYIIANPIKTQVIKTKFGSYPGKSHKDLILKVLNGLNNIKYILAEEVLTILQHLSLDIDQDIRDKALDIVKKFSKYNYNVLKSNIGYGAQRKFLDFILAISTNDLLKYIDFITLGIKELLSSSFEGSTAKSPNTIVIHSGAISVTPFIISLRKEAIQLAYRIYLLLDNDKEKIKIIEVLNEAMCTPVNDVYGEELKSMIVDDVSDVLKIYNQIIFDKNSNIQESLSVIGEIDDNLDYLIGIDFLNITEVVHLQEKINSNELYNLYSSIIGDSRLFKKDKISWEEANIKKNELIEVIIKKINKKTIKSWIETLNIIAAQNAVVDEWQFSHFKLLIRKLSEQKPDIGYLIMVDAWNLNKPLKNIIFLSSFLSGIRNISKYNFWDTFTTNIINSKNLDLLPSIFYSFGLDMGSVDNKKIRPRDIAIIQQAVHRSGKFNFVKGHSNLNLTFSIILLLVSIYAVDKTKIEGLIITELDENLWAKNSHIRALATAVHREQIDPSYFLNETKIYLKDWLINFNDLDHDAQEFLLSMGRGNVSLVLDVFIGRIIKASKVQKRGMGSTSKKTYEPIPFHLNRELISSMVADKEQYTNIVKSWMSKITPNWSLYNWNLSQFLEKIGEPSKELVLGLIKSDNKLNLRKATYLINQFYGVDIETCLEIIKRTDDKKIISHVVSLLYSTGVVSGEYGIAEAYENKVEQFKKYLDDSNKRVRAFSERIIKQLLEDAKRERKRVDEENELRRVEFDG